MEFNFTVSGRAIKLKSRRELDMTSGTKMGFHPSLSTFYLNDLEANCKIFVPYGIARKNGLWRLIIIQILNLLFCVFDKCDTF